MPTFLTPPPPPQLLSNVYDITSLSSADSVTYSPTSGTQYGLVCRGFILSLTSIELLRLVLFLIDLAQLNVYEHMMTADEVLERYNSLSTCDATLPSVRGILPQGTEVVVMLCTCSIAIV